MDNFCFKQVGFYCNMVTCSTALFFCFFTSSLVQGSWYNMVTVTSVLSGSVVFFYLLLTRNANVQPCWTVFFFSHVANKAGSQHSHSSVSFIGIGLFFYVFQLQKKFGVLSIINSLTRLTSSCVGQFFFFFFLMCCQQSCELAQSQYSQFYR